MLRKVIGTSLHYEMMFSDWFLLFNSHLTSTSQDQENYVTEFAGAILSYGVVSGKVTGSVHIVAYIFILSIVKG